MAILNDQRGSVDDPVYVLITTSDPNTEPLNEYLRNPSNSNQSTNLNMNVRGDNSQVNFRFVADQEKDIVVSSIIMIITDSTVDTDRFGNVDTEGEDAFKLSLFKDDGSGGHTEIPIIRTVKILEELVEQADRFEPFDDRFDGDAPAIGIKLFFSVAGNKMDGGSTDYFEGSVLEDLRGLNKFRILMKGAKITAS